MPLLVLISVLWLVVPVAAAQVTTEGPTTIYPATDAGPTWAEVREQGEGTLRVLYVPAEGFAYHGEDGVLTGVSIEIMRDFAVWVAIHRGVHLELDFVAEESWPHFYDRVRSARGGVVGLGNVTITEDRRRELAFSPPYLTNVAVLITRADVPPLENLDAIDAVWHELTPLAFEGTLHERRLRELVPDRELAFASSNDEIIERVAGGGYFAYIDAYGYFGATDRGLPLERHPAGDDPGEEFGFIMPRGSDWTAPLQAFFAHGDGYLASERYRRLLVDHLGEGVAEALLQSIP